MHVAIRCNGSRLLGLGDLAFGRDLRDALAFRGVDCVIAAERSAAARGFLGEAGALWLPEGVGPAEELDWLAAQAKALGWRHLFVVRFDRPLGPYAALRTPCMGLGCVDFSGRAFPGFDLVVNWDPDAPTQGFPGSVVLAGPRYVPLRPGVRAFMQAVAPVGEQVQSVLVTMGGTDVSNMTGVALNAAARAFPRAELRAVLGLGCDEGAALAPLGAQARKRVTIMRNVAEMGAVLAPADLVVTAGGLTLFESLALGRPSVCLPVVEHQRPRCEALHSMGAAFLHGDFRDEVGLEAALLLLGDPRMRAELSRRAGRTVGVDGLALIAQAVERTMNCKEKP